MVLDFSKVREYTVDKEAGCDRCDAGARCNVIDPLGCVVSTYIQGPLGPNGEDNDEAWEKTLQERDSLNVALSIGRQQAMERVVEMVDKITKQKLGKKKRKKKT